MPLTGLFNPRRYARCRQIFGHPLRAHVMLALGSRRPLTLEFLVGGPVTFEKPRSFRRVFNLLLAASADPLPVTWADGLVHFEHAGQRIGLRPDTTDAYVFGEICLDDCYGLAREVGPLETVVDLGANIGLFAAHAAARARRVIAVEPVAANREVARRNLSRQIAAGTVRLVAAAVGAESGGTTRIYLSANSGGHSIDAAHAGYWGNGGYEDAHTLSLADLFAEHKIDRCSLLKCDVEGAEYDILGAAPIALLSRIDRIALEAHVDRQSLPPARLTDLVARLRVAGLRVEHPPIDLRESPRQSLLVRGQRAALAGAALPRAA